MKSEKSSLSPRKKKKDVRKDKKLFAEIHTVAPAPKRDYHGLQLYQKMFVWTQWKVSRGPLPDPIQSQTIPIVEYIKDRTLRNELNYVFGEETANLISDLAYEKWSLTSMPSEILQKIFSYISVPDILRLSQVCKRLSKECSKNELWKNICKRQWKILTHNDIEKAALIGWKRIYLEKMRPRKYKTAPNLQRSRLGSVSALNSPDSRTSKSNFTIRKRVQELKSFDPTPSASEIFGRDFKVMSVSTGKLTDRSYGNPKGRCSSRNSDIRSMSNGKCNPAPRSTTHSSINFLPLGEKSRESQLLHKNKSPSISKSKITSIRLRPETARSSVLMEFRHPKSRTDISRPNTGTSTKTKQ